MIEWRRNSFRRKCKSGHDSEAALQQQQQYGTVFATLERNRGGAGQFVVQQPNTTTPLMRTYSESENGDVRSLQLSLNGGWKGGVAPIRIPVGRMRTVSCSSEQSCLNSPTDLNSPVIYWVLEDGRNGVSLQPPNLVQNNAPNHIPSTTPPSAQLLEQSQPLVADENTENVDSKFETDSK